MIEEATGPEEEKSSLGLTWRELGLLLVLAAVQLTNILDFMIVMPLKPFMDDLGLTPQKFGAIVSAYAFSASLAGFLAAGFIDRFSRKQAMLVLYTGFIIGTGICAASSGFWMLLLARCVTGAFGGLLGAMVFTIIGDSFPDKKRGLATGVVMGSFSLASIAGVPLGLIAAQFLGWKAPFAILVGASSPVLLGAFFLLPSLKGHLGQGKPPARGRLAILLEPLHLRAFLFMGVIIFGGFMVVPYLAHYMVANVGLLKSDLKYIYLCGGLTTLVTSPLIGRLSDRFGKLRVFTPLALFAVLPTLLVTNLGPLPLYVALLISTIYMMATSGRMVPAMALVMGCVRPADRGGFLSLNASVQHLASGLGAQIAALLVGTAAGGALTGFSWVGLCAAISMIASVPLAGRLRPAQGGLEAIDVLEGAKSAA